MIRTLALLGHSCSGKTTCAIALGGEDMDAHVPTDLAPGLERIINYLLKLRKPLVAVSVHVAELTELGIQKVKGERPDFFARFLFVYLKPTKEDLKSRIERERPSQAPLVIKNYEKDDAIFSALKDVEVATSSLSKHEVHAIVRCLLPSQ
jgi:hypothetical protein